MKTVEHYMPVSVHPQFWPTFQTKSLSHWVTQREQFGQKPGQSIIVSASQFDVLFSRARATLESMTKQAQLMTK